MSFVWHHPSYYKKLKQNSRGVSQTFFAPKDTVSEASTPPTMETKVGQVGSHSSAHTNHKEDK